MGRRVISVIGAGMVGEHVAFLCALNELGDIRLFDIVDGIPQGKALDMSQAGPPLGYDSLVTGHTTTPDGQGYEALEGSDVVVLTAGFPRKPGMSRDDLLWKNFDIVAGVSGAVRRHAQGAFLIVVTNPLDVMTYTALRVSGFPKHMVVGQAGILDTSRFRTFLSWELGVSSKNISAFVLGGHGDSMVPSLGYTNVGGTPVTDLAPRSDLDAIVERTRKGGGEIVAHLKKGSAYYAPAASTFLMVESFLKDKKMVAPCCAYLDGEDGAHYGVDGYCVGVPVVIGAGGVERIIRVDLQGEELDAWKRSCGSVRPLVEMVRAKVG